MRTALWCTLSKASDPAAAELLDIRRIADRQPLPEYGLAVARDGKHELVTLFRDPAKPGRLRRGIRPQLLPPLR